MKSLNQHIELVCDISNKIDDTISLSRVEYNIELKKVIINEIEKNLAQYQSLLNELLNDYKCDFISQEDYEDFKQRYLYETNKLNIEKENLKIRKMNTYNLEWINKFKNIGRIEMIDRNIVDCFIENVTVQIENNNTKCFSIFLFTILSNFTIQ